MAYVDTEKLKKNIRVNLMPNVDIDGTVTVENAERFFLNLIDKTSTADVVEVVRCKDCKYLAIWNTPDTFAYCEKIHYAFEPFATDTRTHFCSFGEKKE